MINGNNYDWESMEINLNGACAVMITEISYSDERPIDLRYGKGGTPRGYGRQNYKASGAMKLDRSEADRLRTALGGSFYKGDFPITVSYANDDMPTVTDRLPRCKITKTDTSGKQGDSNVGEMGFDFQILDPIKWNGVDAY